MTTWERIAEKARRLPAGSQRKLLVLVERLEPKERTALRDPAGILADLDVDLTEEDISEARKEQWKHFPRKAV